MASIRSLHAPHFTLLPTLLLTLVGALHDAHAEPVFKCRDSDGQLTYQDQPCPPGTDQPAPLILQAPYQPTPPPEPARPASAAKTDADPAPPARPIPPPPPALYRCIDAVSKKSYVTANPPTAGRYVPYWTMQPGGVSSGGLSADMPAGPRDRPHAVAAYVYVEDRCHGMPIGELCGYWRTHLDEVHAQRRTAFNDTRPQLEQEEDGLRDQLATYCQ